MLAAARPPAPLKLILHSAFCCSTLLARALDLPGIATALKEPVLLNDVVGCRRGGMDPARVAPLLADAMALLARPLLSGEAVVIKPSNIVNALAPAMLAMGPNIAAVLLYAPLRVFLGSVARKGMWGRLWVRELLAGQLADGIVRMGFLAEDHFRQTDLQVAAVGWLAQHALFGTLIERFGATRVRSLDSDLLMARPADALGALGELFTLPLDVPAILAGPAFTTDSKTGNAFDARDRGAAIDIAASLHADEIEKVAVWAEAVAASAGIALDLPAPLIK
ncbi:hypothetical protein [Sphingomonas nostoxanthinifaciens]|uniref:hypothetical protein n=1 Tax=Sphingomonas nostoxanthinifaciens TaxID=2872652 RepID=UPI001CC1D891|nr:hypothetical protein [Sphingomonas nostoxanthinifaciens]